MAMENHPGQVEDTTGASLVGQGVSVVVPVYNSQGTLAELVVRLQKVLAEHASQYEVILVNDASSDGSWEVVQTLCKEFSWLRGVNLMRNFGQHNSLLCGIRLARYPICATLDDDLQNPPEELPRLLDELAKGYDVVYGAPRLQEQGLWRNLASRVTRLALQAAMGMQTARKVSPFRVFRTKLRRAFAQYRSPFVSIDVLLTWGGGRFGAVPVKHDPRRHGRSNYTFHRLVVLAINMMTGFSAVPLKLASLLGFGFTIFGMIVLLYVLGRYLIVGYSVPGFPFLASIVAIFSGAQLFALGIIGEYLARIHFRTMDRPAYVVDSQIGLEDD